MSSPFEPVSSLVKKLGPTEGGLIPDFTGPVTIQKVKRYLENLPPAMKYSEQTRIYDQLNRNRESCQGLFIQLFEYVEFSKTYEAILIEKQFKENWKNVKENVKKMRSMQRRVDFVRKDIGDLWGEESNVLLKNISYHTMKKIRIIAKECQMSVALSKLRQTMTKRLCRSFTLFWVSNFYSYFYLFLVALIKSFDDHLKEWISHREKDSDIYCKGYWQGAQSRWSQKKKKETMTKCKTKRWMIRWKFMTSRYTVLLGTWTGHEKTLLFIRFSGMASLQSVVRIRYHFLFASFCQMMQQKIFGSWIFPLSFQATFRFFFKNIIFSIIPIPSETS